MNLKWFTIFPHSSFSNPSILPVESCFPYKSQYSISNPINCMMGSIGLYLAFRRSHLPSLKKKWCVGNSENAWWSFKERKRSPVLAPARNVEQGNRTCTCGQSTHHSETSATYLFASWRPHKSRSNCADAAGSQRHSMKVVMWIELEKRITCLFVRHLAHCQLWVKRLEVLPSLGRHEMSSAQWRTCRFRNLASCRQTRPDPTTYQDIGKYQAIKRYCCEK